MRMTLTLDEDIATALRDRARAQGRSFERVVNEALRRGISITAREDITPYKLVPNRSGFAPGMDPLRLNQLGEDL